VDLLRAFTRGSRLRSLARISPSDEVAAAVEIPTIEEHASVRDVVLAAAATSVHRYIEHEPFVRLGEVEALHRARVSIRRLHVYLRLFGSVIDRSWRDELGPELRWLIDILGATRDLDVILERVRDGAPVVASTHTRAADAVVVAVGEARDRSIAEMRDALRSDRYLALVDRLITSLGSPTWLDEAGATGKKRLAPFVREPWSSLRSAERSIGLHPSDRKLHRLRIKAKRVRYASEAVAPVFGPPASAFADAAAELQDALGDAQDAVIVVTWIQRWAAIGGSSRTAAAEDLAAAVERLGKREEHWRAAWTALSAKRLRRWFA
jgi:CHAD domain-containing protein